MRSIKVAICLLISASAFAQFSSKKEEKFYYKIDDAYLDYDYETILEAEEEITPDGRSLPKTLRTGLQPGLRIGMP